MEDLHCPNPFCKQPNPIASDFCQGCHTFLPKRYLWLASPVGDRILPGSILYDRYLVLYPHILLDQYPANPPEIPQEISILLEAYLKLSHLVPHLPKVYSVITIENEECILLEETAIYPYIVSVIAPENSGDLVEVGTLMPTLQSEWATASPFRLLNWIYQIATMWEIFNQFKVTETLFDPDCIRVDGSIVKILALKLNSKKESIHSLPLLLQHLIHYSDLFKKEADSTTIRRLREMYEKLIHEPDIDHSYLLCEWLDQEMIQHHNGSMKVTIVTQTDRGPNRVRNEDSCYPSSDSQKVTQQEFNSSDSNQPLLVVCDGIGGHEGGNIASNLAIQTFTQILNDRIPKIQINQSSIDRTKVLQEAIQISNDVISDRNDEECRSDRQRMGTTIVLAHIDFQRLQIAHVGDSRAYRITSRGCYQLTVDDDVASREVRLGYTLYRDALQHNGSGALTQALGMVSSSLLHPTVRTSFIDEDCIYLLCSDGLSDFDRIEEFWAQELIPVLYGRTQLVDACQNLIEIANAHNGHDNVTIGLLYCKVPDQQSLTSSTPSTSSSASWSLWNSKPQFSTSTTAENNGNIASTTEPYGSSQIRTQLVEKRQSSRTPSQNQSSSSQGKWIFLASILVAIGVMIAVIALLFGPSRQRESALTGLSASTPINPLLPQGLTINQIVKIVPSIDSNNKDSSNNRESIPNVVLLPKFSKPENGEIDLRVGEVKPGSILRVVDRQIVPAIGQNIPTIPWVKLQVCSVESPTEIKQVKPGVEGWHAEATLLAQVTPVTTPLSTIQNNACPAVDAVGRSRSPSIANPTKSSISNP